MTTRRWVVIGVIAALIIMVLLVGPGTPSTGMDLDPRSTLPVGAAGVSDVLEELGVDVEISATLPQEHDRVLLILDDVSWRSSDSTVNSRIERWVEEGGVLVVADPYSMLSAPIAEQIGRAGPYLEPNCDLDVANGVELVGYSDGIAFQTDPGEMAVCFPYGEGYFYVENRHGAGRIISIGSSQTFSNELLGREDTGVFVVNVLTPPDTSGVMILYGGEGLDGDTPLLDLLGQGAKVSLYFQIPLVWIVALWTFAPRFGRLLTDDPPAEIDASKNTAAIGTLLHTAQRSVDAARIIRLRTQKQLANQLGVDTALFNEAVVDAVQARTRLSREKISWVLNGQLPTTDTDLAQFAHDAAMILHQTSLQNNDEIRNAVLPDAPDLE